MPSIIQYLQTPLYFNATQMAAEVQQITHHWTLHYNTNDYTGNWSALALRSPGGNLQNLMAESSQPFLYTSLLHTCPYLTQVIESLPGEKMSARLLKLSSGAIIKEHRDIELAFEQGEARLHIPIITHPLVEFWLDGHRITMGEGECWYINANLPHKLNNASPIDRIHLVVDVKVTPELTTMFMSETLPFKQTKELADDFSVLQRTIEELMLTGDPVKIKLAEELQQQIPL